MTGIRSWTTEVAALGVVVRIEQVSTILPLPFFQLSHIPANANSFPSSTSTQYGCFTVPVFFHSQNPSAGIMHRRNFNASRNASFVAAVSDLALIIWAPAEESFAHEGISPQRSKDNSRMGSFGFRRITGTGCVGAML